MNFKTIYHADPGTVRAMYREFAPVFVLNTGRSGSKFVAELLNRCSGVRAHHEPSPVLMYFSNFAFHHQHQPEILTSMINAARMESILHAYVHGEIYVESNQCLVFFATALRELFGRAKFVHLVRNPADFVRGAARRGFYTNDTIWTAGRVRLQDEAAWRSMDLVEKLCWYWQTVHQHIEDFTAQIGAERVMLCRAEDLWTDVKAVEAFLAFVGAGTLSAEAIASIQAVKVNDANLNADMPDNIVRVGGFPEYPAWNEEWKLTLKRYTSALCETYQYDVDTGATRIALGTPGGTPRSTGMATPLPAIPAWLNARSEYRPLLSVIVPSYNTASCLRECLDSVLAQTYTNLEIVVSDDASTDGSPEIIREYANRYPDRIKALFGERNLGVAANLNHAIAHAQGEYLTTLDSDDYYYDQRKLEYEIALATYYRQKENRDIAAFSDLAMVTGDGQYMGQRDPAGMIKEGSLFEDMLTHACMIPCNYVIRAEICRRIGGYCVDPETDADLDFHLKVAAEHEFYFTGLNGRAYRQHDKGSHAYMPFHERTAKLWKVFYANLPKITDQLRRRELTEKFSRYMNQRESQIEVRVNTLQEACDNRLHLIDDLQRACDERLRLIDELHRIAQERSQVIGELHGVAQERKELIERLDGELKRRQA